MSQTFRIPDGTTLAFEVEGDGPPILWQHGLGATSAQPAEVFPDGFQRITLMCRGHQTADGTASDLGNADNLSIAQFTDDAFALLNHLNIQALPVGGISLGAAISLRLAALHPARVSSLILARPAWVADPGPETLASYPEVARLLAKHGQTGRALFQSGRLYRDLAIASPDNAASLSTFFTRPQPETTVALLSKIPLDGPGITKPQIQALTLPTLILTTTEDYVHPEAMGEALAALIPHATLTRLPPKFRDKAGHVAAFKAALAAFLS